GSGNWKEGVGLTGANRTINREKLSLAQLNTELDDPSSLRSMIFNGYSLLLKARSSHRAFHPAAAQKILDIGPSIFGLIRTSSDGRGVLCLQSVSSENQRIELPSEFSGYQSIHDIYGDVDIPVKEGCVEMTPWQVLWLENDN
ncbi:MAG: alpha-amylase, partial [Spirochaetes bacterium]